MSERCQAVNDDDKRCRRTRDLTFVRIATDPTATVRGTFSAVKLPHYLVVALCPKHFVMKSREK